MPLSIKVNLRVTGHCNQGGRKYMEDMFSVAYQQTSDDKDLEYAFFGIFDGHGGGEAATFAKEHLMDIIVKQKNFWSDKDEDVLRAIRDGYVNTHYAMWRELEKWPRTASGLPSTAGTTASIAFIRKGKIYIGHVGDSGIILGYQDKDDPQWKARPLTRDHKPESIVEMTRIHESGGKVVSKSGVPRVVWNRPRIGHKGPVRRSTHIDEIPFLAVARSLGDLWSYNSELDTFVVSPEPDVKVITVDVESHRCLIFGTDGLWNMLTPQAAVAIVQAAERHNEKHFIASQQTGNGTDTQMWINPSKSLVDRALERWSATRLRADNTSVVTLMLDPPGPSRGEVLLSRKKESVPSPKCVPASPLLYTNRPLYDEPIERPINTATPRIPISPEIDNTVQDQPEKPVEAAWLMQQNVIINNVNQNSYPIVVTETPEISEPDLNGTIDVNDVFTVVENTVLENIQVAEISSSDISSDEITSVIEDEMLPPEQETLDHLLESRTNIIETVSFLNPLMSQMKHKIEKPIENKKFPDTEGENYQVLVRQKAFPGSCNELSNYGPRLTRSTTGLPGSMMPPPESPQIDNLRNSLSPDTARRRQHGKSLNSSLEKCPGLLRATRSELRSAKRRQSTINSLSLLMPATSSCADDQQKTPEVSVESRLEQAAPLEPEKEIKTGETLNTKRRHSSTFEIPEQPVCSTQEPSFKRRTRSEDRPCPTDENNPVNRGQCQQLQSQLSRLYWPTTCSMGARLRTSSGATTSCQSAGVVTVNVQEKIPSPTSFQRRSLAKKATPVKTIRRPSINGSSRNQLRGSFALRDWDQAKLSHRPSCSNNRSRLNRSINGGTPESASSSTPQRWLRSDTIAATPIKTLRSRNVDIAGHTVPPQIAHQYGIVKPNRLSLAAKIKISNPTKVKTTASLTATRLKQTAHGNSVGPNGSSTSVASSVTGIAKRVKSSPYDPSARSLGTRSRLKRLSK